MSISVLPAHDPVMNPMKRKLEEYEASSARSTPPPPHEASSSFAFSNTGRPRPRSFPPNASLALIGLRGVGKSTIGVIASATLRRRLIDADVNFVTVTGMSVAQYVSVHGWPRYRAKEAELLAELLRENDTGAVIVCSGGCVEKTAGRTALKEWMTTHPIIHIIRNEGQIEEYIKRQSSKLTESNSTGAQPAMTISVLRRLAAKREPTYAECSNFQFYNLWDKQMPSSTYEGRPSSLTLKKVEQDFLRLLNFIYQKEMAPLVVYDRNAPHPQSKAAVSALEDKMYTYSLAIPPSPTYGSLTASDLDLDNLGSFVEAFEIRVDNLLHGFKPAEDRDKDGFEAHRFLTEQFAYVRRNSELPIIYSLSTVNQKGCFPAVPGGHGENSYFNFLYHGLRLGAEYLVVELGFSESKIKDLIRLRGATKIIGSWSESRPSLGWDSVERRKMYDYAANLGCDLVRLSQKANSMEDNFAAVGMAWEVIRKRRKAFAENKATTNLPPLIAINTGKLGRTSRILNPILSPVTEPILKDQLRQQRERLLQQQQQQASQPTLSDDDEDRASEVTPREALQAIHASSILPRLKFCIFGAAISHSLSPAMHNAAYAAYGMPHDYGIVNSDSFNDLLHIIQDPSFGGAAITLPYKVEIISVLHSISDHARAIGAVNSVVPIRGGGDGISGSSRTNLGGNGVEDVEGGLHGDNTDWIGIRSCTLRYLTPVNAITARTTALIIGAGGMARAAIYGLQTLGVENVFVHNRTHSRAVDLAAYFNARNSAGSGTNTPNGSSMPPPVAAHRSTVRVLQSLDEAWPRGFSLPSIIISCIPGTNIKDGTPSNFTAPEGWLMSPTGGVCIELDYKPRVTALLKQIRALAKRGWIGVDGLEVLPEQGYAQFEIFLGRKAPRKIMRDAVESAWLEREKKEQQDAQGTSAHAS